MKTYKEQTKTVVVIDTCVCNMCGESLQTDYGPEGLVATIMGGYGSKLGDTVKYDFDICETCLNKLFKQFIVPVTVDGDLEEGEERVIG